MKVLLFSEKQNTLKKSGIGRALYHQMKALELNDVEYTLDPKDKYDLVHINTIFSKSYKLLKKTKKNKIPVIVHGHSTKEDFLNSFKFSNQIAFWFNNCIMRMYSKADLIITPTNYSKKLISNYKGVNCEIVNISNGIDLDRFTNDNNFTEQEINLLNEKLKLKKNEKYILGIGMYFVRKGLHDFIEVAKQFPDIKFVWLGQKYPFITSLKINKALKNKTKNVILPGYLSEKEVRIALKNASLFFFPSYEETEGIVVLEALASKTPVLIRDIGVFDDWLIDGVNCIKANNNEEFIDKIDYILKNPMEGLIEEGLKVLEKRTLLEVGKKLKKTYQNLVNKNKLM
ncbi:MAG: glycosyltransferase family 4 protein [Bacilli bacterium]